MKYSETIGKLAEALAETQDLLENPPMDSTNPYFHSKFASLKSVRDVAKPALAANGISVLQILGGNGEIMTCETVLLHQSGEWISGEVVMPIGKKGDPQAAGSAATYARRYGLLAILNIVGDPDDDANSASKNLMAKSVAEANITPMAGAGDDLSEEGKKKVQDLAMTIIASLKIENVKEAFAAANGLENEEKIYLWSLLDSKQRSALKKYGEKVRQEGGHIKDHLKAMKGAVNG